MLEEEDHSRNRKCRSKGTSKARVNKEGTNMLKSTGDCQKNVDRGVLWVAFADGPTDKGYENNDKRVTENEAVEKPSFVFWKSPSSPVEAVSIGVQEKQSRQTESGIKRRLTMLPNLHKRDCLTFDPGVEEFACP